MPIDTMGFKSSVAIAQTTRFKRKMLPTAFSPPATPFNDTSFLIQLQQLREQHNNHRSSSPTNHGRFDQYGSMDKIIAASFAGPASPKNRSIKSVLHSSPSSGIRSQNSECSTGGKAKGGSDSPESRILPCESDDAGMGQQSSSSSDDASSTVTQLNIETRSEKREGEDGMLRSRHSQHCTDNFNQHAESSGSDGS